MLPPRTGALNDTPKYMKEALNLFREKTETERKLWFNVNTETVFLEVLGLSLNLCYLKNSR